MALTREQREKLRQAVDEAVRLRLALRKQGKEVPPKGAAAKLLAQNGWDPHYALIAAVAAVQAGEEEADPPPLPQRTVCRNGHELAEDNLYYGPSGKMTCRRCRNDAKQRYRKKVGWQHYGTRYKRKLVTA